MKLFKNRDLQSKKDKNSDEKTVGKPDMGKGSINFNYSIAINKSC